jgi:hypothetical protein
MLLRSLADHQQVDETNKHLGIDDILTFFQQLSNEAHNILQLRKHATKKLR